MKMHLKSHRTKLSKIKIIVLLFILLLSFFLILLNKVGNSLSKYYLDYSTARAKEIIDISLNNAVSNDVLKEYKDSSIYSVTLNKKGEIETIDYNSLLINVLLKKISTNLYNNLKKEEKGKKANFSIPMMAFSNNPIIANKGPKLPVRIKPVGYVISEVRTNVKPCGINSSLIEIKVHLEIKEKVILPLISKEIKVENNIPLFYKIISGKVPKYYGGIYSNKSSSFSFPIE